MLTILGWIAAVLAVLAGMLLVVAFWMYWDARRYTDLDEYHNEQARLRLDAVQREWDRQTTVEQRARAGQ